MKTKNQYTKRQTEAINDLLVYLDELDNKPRRLYHALEELALAFGKVDAVPSIREAQDFMYSHINEGDHYRELFTSLREFKLEVWKEQLASSVDEHTDAESLIRGADNFIKKHISRLVEHRSSF